MTAQSSPELQKRPLSEGFPSSMTSKISMPPVGRISETRRKKHLTRRSASTSRSWYVNGSPTANTASHAGISVSYIDALMKCAAGAALRAMASNSADRSIAVTSKPAAVSAAAKGPAPHPMSTTRLTCVLAFLSSRTTPGAAPRAAFSNAAACMYARSRSYKSLVS